MKAESERKTVALHLYKGGAFDAEIKAVIPAEWKADVDADTEGNVLIGYASMFGGPPDLGGDIVLKGAYKKTISERIPAGRVPLTDGHQYDSASIVGIVTDAQETETGLLIKARLSSAENVQSGIKVKLMEGLIKGLSIGYRAIDVDYKRWEGPGEWEGETVRVLKEVRLHEIAVTATPMQETADILSVKSVKATPFAALDMAPASHPWDPEGALARVKSWANADEKPNAKIMQAFLGFKQADAESLDACKGLVCDVRNNRLQVVPGALFSFGADVLESRHGEKKTDEYPHELLTHAEKYFNMIGVAAPWRAKSLDVALLRSEAGQLDRPALERAALKIKSILGDEAGPVNPPTTGEEKTQPKQEDARREELRKFFGCASNEKG